MKRVPIGEKLQWPTNNRTEPAMAVYRFRVFIEDNHEIYRDIEVFGRHDFADLHQAVIQAYGFQPGQSSEYITSDSSWYAGNRIVALDGDLKGDPARIVSHINDPHQRFLCVTVSHKPVELAIELLKIIADSEEGATYPRCVKSHGDAPFYTQPPVRPTTPEVEEDEEKPARKKRDADDEPTDEQIGEEDTDLLNDDTESSGNDDEDMDDDEQDDDDDEESNFSDFDVDDL